GRVGDVDREGAAAEVLELEGERLRRRGEGGGGERRGDDAERTAHALPLTRREQRERAGLALLGESLFYFGGDLSFGPGLVARALPRDRAVLSDEDGEG